MEKKVTSRFSWLAVLKFKFRRFFSRKRVDVFTFADVRRAAEIQNYLTKINRYGIRKI